MLFRPTCRIKRESEEEICPNVNYRYTRSVKNKERAVQLDCCLYSL